MHQASSAAKLDFTPKGLKGITPPFPHYAILIKSVWLFFLTLPRIYSWFLSFIASRIITLSSQISFIEEGMGRKYMHIKHKTETRLNFRWITPQSITEWTARSSLNITSDEDEDRPSLIIGYRCIPRNCHKLPTGRDKGFVTLRGQVPADEIIIKHEILSRNRSFGNNVVGRGHRFG